LFGASVVSSGGPIPVGSRPASIALHAGNHSSSETTGPRPSPRRAACDRPTSPAAPIRCLASHRSMPYSLQRMSARRHRPVRGGARGADVDPARDPTRESTISKNLRPGCPRHEPRVLSRSRGGRPGLPRGLAGRPRRRERWMDRSRARGRGSMETPAPASDVRGRRTGSSAPLDPLHAARGRASRSGPLFDTCL